MYKPFGKKHGYAEVSRRLTPKTLYFLGVVASDGSLKRKYNIALELKDHEVVQNFVHHFFEYADVPLHYRRQKDTVKIDLSMPNLTYLANKCGIFQDKTFNLELSSFLLSHRHFLYFVRGYIDGDGYINSNAYYPSNIGIDIIAASPHIINQFYHHIPFKSRVRQDRTYHRIHWQGRYAQELATALPIEEYMMKRKNTALQNLLQRRQQQPSHPIVGIHVLKNGKYKVTPWDSTLKKQIYLGSYTNEQDAINALNDWKKHINCT